MGASLDLSAQPEVVGHKGLRGAHLPATGEGHCCEVIGEGLQQCSCASMPVPPARVKGKPHAVSISLELGGKMKVEK